MINAASSCPKSDPNARELGNADVVIEPTIADASQGAVPQSMHSWNEQNNGAIKAEPDDNQGEGDGDERPVDCPSEYIRAELIDILSDLSFEGAFAFNRAYPDAPNPALRVEGLGTIGLPLSIRDAEAIKSKAEPAPFGMGERTVLDKSVRDTWEIDAKQIRFENPAWKTFLGSTYVGSPIIRVAVFSSLRPLSPCIASFLPHVDTEKMDGMFATIVIVLPSKFSGGAVHVSRGSLSSVYDCSPKSLFETSVLAWYTDVKQEVKPITEGFRLALSFNLIHTTSSLRPALSGNANAVEKLRRVLLSWKQNLDGKAPSKVVYLLDHKYSLASLRGSALKGDDAQLVATLDVVAKQLDFRIGLATVVCHLKGYADDCGGGYGNDEVSMAEVEESDVSIETLVDLDGRLITEELEIDTEHEAIPEDLADTLQEEKCDDQDYEGYLGNGAGSLERWYRRTALVIWPKRNDVDIMHGAEGLQYACDTIKASNSASPTADEMDMVDYIFHRASASDATTVVPSVCEAAVRWKDLATWVRVIKVCDAERSIATIGVNNACSAFLVFGFTSIKIIIEASLLRDSSNRLRFQLLDHLQEAVLEENRQLFADLPTGWFDEQRLKIANTLAKPAADECDLMFSLATRYGGSPFLEQSSIIPQLKALADSSFLLDFSAYLHDNMVAADPGVRRRIVKELLSAAISGVDFYASTKKAQAYPYYTAYRDERSEAEKNLMQAQRYIQTCLKTDQQELVPLIIDKLTNFSGQTGEVIQTQAKDVLIPLLSSLTDAIRSRPADRPVIDLRKLCGVAMDQYLRSAARSPYSISKPDLSSVIRAMVLAGQPQVVLTTIIPSLEALSQNALNFQTLAEELHANRENFSTVVPTTDVQTAIVRLGKKYASEVNLPQEARTSSVSYGYWARPATPVTPASVVKPIIDALESCFSLNVLEACHIILRRVVNPALLAEQYVRDILVPLVPELRKVAEAHKEPVTTGASAVVLRKTALAWVEKVLGPRPADCTAQMQSIQRRWTCNCQPCSGVRQFLLHKPERSRTWEKIGAPAKKHVETYLRSCGADKIAAWDTIRTSPQDLKVTKTDAIYHPVRWVSDQKKGYALLKGISGNSEELRMILDSDYNRIVALLHGNGSGITTTTQSSASSSRPAAQAAASTSGANVQVVQNTSRPMASHRIVPRGTSGTQGIQSRPYFHIANPSTNMAPVSTASTSTSAAIAAARPPRKRKKIQHDPTDVIDITSD
ncbi:uncharacterized protein LAESUDRAFT_756442 [Laetiporus sulphureus 93-53]|uniref:Uncharacterized protein n=1 Tax=Laetiporus sulphureus 93-53 TaxID=1314785 RepID=A0A165FW07_9APHY|nr:uncharacterized protein LAESUDRAFT_756442 [Laetiporus sulphureus 93-53]KZT09482.1 hypothetical protein LAESUDRAFT_756442 [Laetiporus sulphureus 93-53]